MIPFRHLAPATFVRRDNRFRAVTTVEGTAVPVHVPNSGRLAELLVPGAQCFVAPAELPVSRLTWGTLQLVMHRGGLVCISAHLANAVFADAWRRGTLGEPFSGYDGLRREIVVGGSRLDFLLSGPDGRLWVEVKCVTLVGDPARGIDDGIARFPDAPTERGARHLRELAARVREGDRAAAVFIVQRCDAAGFTPHASMDPQFAEALRSAYAESVAMHCFGCSVSPEGMAIDRAIPLLMP